MLEYLLHQGVLSLVKLLVFATLVFFLIQIVMPGDFVDQFSLSMTAAEQAEMRQDLGLDLPLWERYLKWMNDLFRLDLGTSFTGQPVTEILKQTIPATLLVFLTGTTLAFLIGLWLGTRTGWAGPSWLSRLTTLGGITLFTSFPPWLAWLVAYAFTRGRGFVIMGELGGLSGVSYRGLDSAIWPAAELQPAQVACRMLLTLLASALVFLLANSILQRLFRRRIPGLILVLLIVAGTVGFWYLLDVQALAFDLVGASWLAVVTYTLLSFGETMLIMQASMAGIRQEAYITTARAKGLPTPVVRERHAARNALLPVLSRLVVSLPYLITGVVIIESSVGWPGMGTSMWNALYWQNMPVVMATVLIVGALSLAARLILDVIIAYLDPRIRYGGQEPTLA
jgi:peptide/nickel transport system permease protein